MRVLFAQFLLFAFLIRCIGATCSYKNYECKTMFYEGGRKRKEVFEKVREKERRSNCSCEEQKERMRYLKCVKRRIAASFFLLQLIIKSGETLNLQNT